MRGQTVKVIRHLRNSSLDVLKETASGKTTIHAKGGGGAQHQGMGWKREACLNADAG